MSTYEPWYIRRSFPVFCIPCVPVYSGIWTARRSVLLIGAVLFAIGVMILFGLLLTCVAIECAAIAGALLPIALILIIVGILLFHCGWAAHLLGTGGVYDVNKTTTTTTTTIQRDPTVRDEEVALFEAANLETNSDVNKQGYWQFEEREAWQTLANPYPIQHTLLNSVSRLPY